jgi:isochorismate synthase
VDESDPLDLFAGSQQPLRFYWEHPASAASVVGLGAAARVEAGGASRFRDASAQADALWAGVEIEGAAPRWAGPLLVGGFGFDDAAAPTSERWRGFPPARLFLPQDLIVRRDGEAWGLTAAPARATPRPPALALPGSSEDPACAPAFRAAPDHRLGDYRAQVERALEAIQGGEFEKVVVARSCTVSGRAPHDPVALLRALRSHHPGCVIFALAFGDACFLGATPEPLVRLARRRVFTAAVAGSAPRGRSPEEDARLGRALRESKKDHEEHALVVRSLRAALQDLCDPLSIPEAPTLLCTEGIQHLHTPVEGVLRDGVGISILELVSRLHPTPAVGGSPRRPALRWLRQHEELDRGWYAGPIGFLGPRGEGEFAVALRSALMRGHEATFFAGAGIVADSDPDAELAETRLKLRTILDALMEI